MNVFKTTIETTVNGELEEIRIKVLGEYQEQVMSLKDKATREALISMGWTPPWNYNMEDAPNDGTFILLKTKPPYEGGEGRISRGSWRVDDGFSGNSNPLWLDDSYDDYSTGYASTPISPVAWKPILE